VRFGSPQRHFRVADSTNSRARELAGGGAPGGTVVTAVEQIAGRGRQGRSWIAPAGKALLYSAILRPLDRRHLLLPLSVPIAVCATAEELEPAVRCQIKWPNDIWIDGRKVAGVLIEARPQDGWAVIGVGLNLAIERDEFPPELRDSAVSLFASGAPAVRYAQPRNTATRVLSEQLSRWTEAAEEDVLTAWRERDALKGREIGWDDDSGVADGIDERGNLLVRVAGSEIVALGAGEVHLRL
jgi:BirA family transcriptional regulator, biotin operon repressor / biotin---[acetyl-CoA-carboxylase] ligase